MAEPIDIQETIRWLDQAVDELRSLEDDVRTPSLSRRLSKVRWHVEQIRWDLRELDEE